MIIKQTEWAKPANQVAMVCQVYSMGEFAVSLSISHSDIIHSDTDVLREKKLRQAKITLMGLIETELDKCLKDFKWPEI